MDHSRHQAQDAARALELHQGGPVVVETVEDLRMNRVGSLQPVLVIRVAALGRELLVLRAIEVVEGPRHCVARNELRLFHQRLEEAPADDLEPFFCARGPPRGFDAPDHIA